MLLKHVGFAELFTMCITSYDILNNSNQVTDSVSGQLPPRKIAPRLGLRLGLALGLELGLELGLRAIFLGGNCPKTQWPVWFKQFSVKLVCGLHELDKSYLLIFRYIYAFDVQKQSSRGVLWKRCS